LLEIWNLQYSKKICEINKEKPKFKNPKALLGRLPNTSARPDTRVACSSSYPRSCLPSGACQTGRAHASATCWSRGELRRAIAHRRWLLRLRQAPHHAPQCQAHPSTLLFPTQPHQNLLVVDQGRRWRLLMRHRQRRGRTAPSELGMSFTRPWWN
jgi:hypothetical protein